MYSIEYLECIILILNNLKNNRISSNIYIMQPSGILKFYLISYLYNI